MGVTAARRLAIMVRTVPSTARSAIIAAARNPLAHHGEAFRQIMEAVLAIMPERGRVLTTGLVEAVDLKTAIIGPAGGRREPVGRVQIGLEGGDEFLGLGIGIVRAR